MMPDDRPEQGRDPEPPPSVFERVYQAVRSIPRGRVTSYGAVAARVTGRRAGARMVGWALHGLPPELEDAVPWWRVINSQGRISISRHPGAAEEQRERLEAEGVAVDGAGRVDLGRYGWEPGDAEVARSGGA